MELVGEWFLFDIVERHFFMFWVFELFVEDYLMDALLLLHCSSAAVHTWQVVQLELDLN